MMKLVFLACLAWSAASAFGCDCVPSSVEEAKEDAEVVFRGTITDIRDGVVVFHVVRVWKGDVGRRFEMPEISGLGCLGFYRELLFTGNDVLVFAWKLYREPDDNEYFTSICTKTQLANTAGDIIRKLGRGRAPANLPSRRK